MTDTKSKLNYQVHIKSVINTNVDAYNHIFRIENYLREIIVDTLDDQIENWWNDLAEEPNLGKIVARCREKHAFERQSKVFFYLPDIYYSELKELRKIITYPSHWKYFKQYFGTETNFKRKIDELVVLRNKVMHSKPIVEHELNAIMARRDWIEECYPTLKKYLIACIDPNEIKIMILDEIKNHNYEFENNQIGSTEIYSGVSKLFFWKQHNFLEFDSKIIEKINKYYSTIISVNKEIASTPELGKAIQITIILNNARFFYLNKEIIKKIN